MVSTSDVIVEQSTVINTEKVEPVITDEDFEKAQKLFQQGKKNLLLNKFDEAVNNIGDACNAYSTKYGEISENCAEVYYFYGKALLELARVENTVLGNALNGVPEDTEPINDSRYGNPEDVKDEEKKEISEQVIDAMCEEKTPETEPTTTETPVTTTETTTVTPIETPVSIIEPTPTEITTVTPVVTTETTTTTTETTIETKEGEEEVEEDVEEGDEAEEDGEENEEQIKDEAEAEEISNLQRAWEMFELAKLIYNKHFNNDMVFKNKRIAECLLKLGEISIEQEIYEQAVNDISESVKLQEECKERDERMLAESFYQLGLAFQFNNQFTESNESFKKSTNILQLRIDKLRGMIESTSDDLEKNSYRDEITELETLLPEMLAKLEEVSEQGQQSMNLIKEAKECFLNSIEKNGTTTTTTDAEVKDITSLVKSKRKISASSEPVTNFKKTKTEDGEEETTTTTEETTTTTTTETVPTTMETEMPAVPAPIEAI